MNRPKRYLVTAALPYANGPMHIGHLTGSNLPADIYVRFLRAMGKDALYICGSDEHGAAITMRAKKEGISPNEIIDKYHNSFVDVFSSMGIKFDYYHRTSSPLHHKTSQDFFRVLYEKGEFIEETSEQYFDAEADQFLADRYIVGTCPKCNHDSAYGDQCENCGSTLSPTELINPKSKLSGAIPTLKKTTHWYLPLDKYQDWLTEWINTGKVDGKQLHDPSEWKNHVLGQCKSWLTSGLQPRAMTRDLTWGVDVPPEIEGAEGKKLYVWLDAPIGYISSTKQWAEENGKDWELYWKDEESALIHFIGKDNIVFHCLIFPSILKAHGDFNLPVNVPANQFMNLEGDKISTSRNWAVWVHEYLKDFEGMQDELRYNLIRNMPEQKDSEFTWKNFQDTVNNELVNNIGNFINRVVVLTNKYYDGVVPAYDISTSFLGSSGDDIPVFHETEMLDLYDKIYELTEFLWKYDFRGALNQLMEISSSGNQVLQFNEPWKLQKEDPESVKAIMNAAIQIVTVLSVCCKPFLPFTSDKIRTMLNLPLIKEEGELVEIMNRLAEGENIIAEGHKIGEPVHLFSRIEDDVIQAQVDKLKNSKVVEAKSEDHAPVKETIEFDDFVKLDLRTATILEAEKVAKAKKLLKLKVDLGFEQRVVVSGIAEHYKPEEIVGNKVVIVTNLAPRKIRGVESNGMILMAENEKQELCFVSPESDNWGNGFVVR